MEINTIIWAIEKLGSASLHRTPKDLQILGEPWFTQFRNMPENEFKKAINEIVEKETVWPAFAVIYQYAERMKSTEEKNICPYCENTGFLLIKSKGRDIAYACRCEIGQKTLRNLKIVSYESLGLPWPEIEKPSFSKKMSKKNRQLIDTFLGRVGKEMLEGSEEKLWEMMADGSLEMG